jgi:PBP1b-binding outer membrane lipoprotein LpoB
MFMNKIKISLILTVTILLLYGCIKEKYKIDYNENTKRPIAEFLKGDSSAATASIKTLALDFNTAFVDVDLTDIGTDLRNEFNGDIKIDIVKDDALLTAYNNANSTTYDPLPASAGSITSFSYTVNSSKKTVKVKTRIKSSELVGQEYALAIRISSASQGEISKMRKIYIVEIKVKNAYEGEYASNGVRTSYGGPTTAAGITGTFPWDFAKYLFTVNATTCELETADGVDIMLLTVNPDNSVTITSHPFGGFATSNDGPCFYTPGTKTFTLNYKYFNGAGNLRRMTETLVLQ